MEDGDGDGGIVIGPADRTLAHVLRSDFEVMFWGPCGGEIRARESARVSGLVCSTLQLLVLMWKWSSGASLLIGWLLEGR